MPMSASVFNLQRFVRTEEPVFTLSVEQYHDMIRNQVLTSDDPVELLEGVLVFKMPKDEPHNVAVDLLNDRIACLLPEGYCYRNQASLTLADGEPEPDGAIVRGERRRFVTEGRKPGPDDTVVVIEVADSTWSRDLGIKKRSYARAGIAEYWVVNLNERVVQVHRKPDACALPEPTYLEVFTYNATDAVPLAIDGNPVGLIRVSDILP